MKCVNTDRHYSLPKTYYIIIFIVLRGILQLIILNTRWNLSTGPSVLIKQQQLLRKFTKKDNLKRN